MSDEKEAKVVRIVRRLPHRPEKVWRALTEPEELSRWFPATMEGAPEPGAPLRFVFPEGGEAAFGEVTEFDPPRVLALTMGRESLRWELQPAGEGCLLILTSELDAANDGAPRASARMAA